MSTAKKTFFLFFILFVVATALNYLARKRMAFAYADLPGYNQLYALNGQLRIKEIKAAEHDYVTIAFAGDPVKEVNDFTVYCDSTLLTRVKAKYLTFKPLTDTKKYTIKVNDVPGNVTIELNYTPDSVYRNAGLPGGDIFEIANANIPVEPGHLYNISDWALTYDEYNSDEENKEAARYLQDSMNIKPGDNTMERVFKIAGFILQRVKGMDGMPNDSMVALSPVNQLKCVQAGRSKLWCGNYTTIFTWFASRAGIPVRLIGCGDYRSSISSGAHVFSEVWVKESQRWQYVDLLAKTVFVKKGDQFLNVIDIYRLTKYSINDPDFTAYYFNGDSIVQKPFNQVASTALYYFHKDNSFTFYFNDYLRRQNPKNLLERLTKIFYARPYYALYGDNIGIGRSAFIFRMITTWLMFFFLILTLLFGISSIRQKSSYKKTYK